MATKQSKPKIKVLVFGTFDHLHPGHESFLKQASELGELLISVSSDKSAKLRGKAPTNTESKRLKAIKSLKLAKGVSIGDEDMNSWSPIKKFKPDIIATGYDQKELRAGLKQIQPKFKFKIKTMKPFKPNTYHSSIIKTCPFCTNTDITKRIIVENKFAKAFPTNIPIVPGHTLIVPKRCVKSFEDLNNNEIKSILSIANKIKSSLEKTFGAEGFNMAWNEGELAGQSVPHFHLHILPRKSGDTGILKYEPRKFIYRPGSREPSPEAELIKIAKLISKNIK